MNLKFSHVLCSEVIGSKIVLLHGVILDLLDLQVAEDAVAGDCRKAGES